MLPIAKFNNNGAKTSRRVNKQGRRVDIQWIVVHYTAGTSSEAGKAWGTASMFKNSSRDASADFIVDDGTIVQYNEDILNRYTWAVGGNKYTNLSNSIAARYYNQCTNLNSVSIEMCSSKVNKYSVAVTDNDWYITDVVINNTRDLVKYLMDLYNVDLEHVIMHNEVTGKWCPQPWVKNEQSLQFWYAFKDSLIDKPVEVLTCSGVFLQSNDNNGIVAGLVTNKEKLDNKELEYRWVACEDDGTPDWFEVSPWTKNNEWLNWKPKKYGNYVIVGYVRHVGESDEVSGVLGVEYHPCIKGTCQLPQEDGSILMGVESYTNEDYRYEISVLDCTLLAQGKDAWIYDSGRQSSTECALWVKVNLDYGYYWTLFQIYDKNSNLLDQQCYGFTNTV